MSHLHTSFSKATVPVPPPQGTVWVFGIMFFLGVLPLPGAFKDNPMPSTVFFFVPIKPWGVYMCVLLIPRKAQRGVDLLGEVPEPVEMQRVVILAPRATSDGREGGGRTRLK